MPAHVSPTRDCPAKQPAAKLNLSGPDLPVNRPDPNASALLFNHAVTGQRRLSSARRPDRSGTRVLESAPGDGGGASGISIGQVQSAVDERDRPGDLRWLRVINAELSKKLDPRSYPLIPPSRIPLSTAFMNTSTAWRSVNSARPARGMVSSERPRARCLRSPGATGGSITVRWTAWSTSISSSGRP